MRLLALLCFALLCFALLFFALLCFALLCFALLCFALLCFACLPVVKHAFKKEQNRRLYYKYIGFLLIHPNILKL
jgi:hypothetical protein